MNVRCLSIPWTMLSVIATISWAEPVKKGRVICEGASCKAHDIPTGSLVERAGDFVEDFSGRTKKRVEIASQPPKKGPNKRAKKSKSETNIQPKLLNLSNLPTYHQGVDRSEAEASEKVVFVPKAQDPRLKGLRSGDIIWAVVDQEIKASPSVPTPVRAMAITGPFKGGLFSGEAILDHELKRVLFKFNRLRFKDRDEVYALKAAGLAPNGSIGLEGEYVSHTGKFFFSELASAAAAGGVDSTIQRNQTALGTYVQESSIANSGKQAAVSALSKTTERMAENAKNDPEYTQVSGYQEIRIFIQEDPVEHGI